MGAECSPPSTQNAMHCQNVSHTGALGCGDRREVAEEVGHKQITESFVLRLKEFRF